MKCDLVIELLALGKRGKVKLERSKIPPVIFCEMNEVNELRKSGTGSKRSVAPPVQAKEDASL